MAFTAADVKKLREMTNVGMMDCKKALSETDGDMDKAVEWLREKGLAKAAKKAGRIAAEGMAYATVCEKCGVGAMVEVNCETDFCAKSAPFVQFVKDICQVVLVDNPASVEAIMDCKYPGTELKVSEVLPEKVMSIGENLQIRRFVRFDKNTSVSYVHMKGKVAVLVELETEASAEAVTELGRDVAMQICALNPQYLDESNVPAADVEKEKEIRIATAKQDPKNAKKPDAIIEKIVVGGLGKWFKEICLLQMPFVKDDKVSVEQHVAAVAKELGTPVTVKGFVRFEKGEGIEKRQDDLAAEVAKMVNG